MAAIGGPTESILYAPSAKNQYVHNWSGPFVFFKWPHVDYKHVVVFYLRVMRHELLLLGPPMEWKIKTGAIAQQFCTDNNNTHT